MVSFKLKNLLQQIIIIHNNAAKATAKTHKTQDATLNTRYIGSYGCFTLNGSAKWERYVVTEHEKRTTIILHARYMRKTTTEDKKQVFLKSHQIQENNIIVVNNSALIICE